MKHVAVLGSTGSIGTQTLEIVSQHPDFLRIVGLAAHSNEELLSRQAREHNVNRAVLFDRDGMDAMVDLATADKVDIVVVAVAGVIGLIPVLAAIAAGKQIALASKEVLVAGGEIVMDAVRRHKVLMTPIDSEHSALFQCLQGSRTDQVETLILTASGGPFRGRSRTELLNVSAAQALQHPTWRMGGKITVDSATLMNKGLETLEARWLFEIPIDNIEAVIHPQSIIHSFVRFLDGSVICQMGWPNMKLPIQYALLYPERTPNLLPKWGPLDSRLLTFEPVDHETFPSVRIAVESARIGGTMPAAMNAANEVAANGFLNSDVSFLGIADTVQYVMDHHKAQEATLESILLTDQWARETARNYMALER